MNIHVFYRIFYIVPPLLSLTHSLSFHWTCDFLRRCCMYNFIYVSMLHSLALLIITPFYFHSWAFIILYIFPRWCEWETCIVSDRMERKTFFPQTNSRVSIEENKTAHCYFVCRSDSTYFCERLAEYFFTYNKKN